MPRLRTKTHQWVKHSLKAVSVVMSLDNSGEPEIIEFDDQRSQVGYGCMSCSIPLDRNSILTDCPGDTEV